MNNRLDRLLKLLIAMIFYSFYKFLSGIIFIIKKKKLSNLVIITYHSITSGQSSKFAKQMDMLLKTGEPVRLDCPIPERYNRNYLAVTFDDGYQSVIQNALPILKDRKIPATFFVPTGALGKNPPWVKNAKHPFAKETVLTAEQLKTLPKDIITIGSHTDTHCRLSKIDADTFRKEIGNSKKQLELLSGGEVKLISVPYGQFDNKFTELFREAGYRMVFLNIPTFPASKTDLFVMGRVSVGPGDWPLEYSFKLMGAYQWLPLAIRLKNTLLRRNVF